MVKILPQTLVNIKVKNECKKTYMDDPVIKKAIEDIEKEFDSNGRVLIRPSGTEPLIRIMIEGEDQEVIEIKAKELARIMEERLS